MQQYYFAARLYDDISVRQPLTAEQAEQFEPRGSSGEIELFIVKDGCFMASSIEPGVLFLDDPGNIFQLFIRLEGDDTYWSYQKALRHALEEAADCILKECGTLADMIRQCKPINSHPEYKNRVMELMEGQLETDPYRIERRQVLFTGWLEAY